MVNAECARQELSHQLARTKAELEELKAQTQAEFGYNARQWLAKKFTNVSTRTNGSSTNPSAGSSTTNNNGVSSAAGSTLASFGTLS